MDLSELRNEYAKATLDESNVETTPLDQFQKWFDEARTAEILEPNAMVLSTASALGQPSQRTVLLKKFDQEGFVFFTNYSSRKATEISENGNVSVLFPWYALERQVIIQGKAEKVKKSESLSYFLSRPFGSQLGAWVSEQSKVISSRGLLESQLHKMKEKFENGKVPLPDFWGGYRIVPHYFEFWQGRKNRLHDRISYNREAENWIIQRLSP